MIINPDKNNGTLNKNHIFKTILRDMADGVMVINNIGEIVTINPSGKEILGLQSKSTEQILYAQFMETDDKNEIFHQFILDAVYDKEKSHTGLIDYFIEGEKKKLKLTSSFIFSEDKTQHEGISIVFSDVTEVENQHQLRHDSSVIFASLMSILTIYIYIYSIKNSFLPQIRPGFLTLIIVVLALGCMIIILKKTSFSVANFTLKLKNPLQQMKLPILISVIGFLLLILIKYGLNSLNVSFFPKDKPFFDFERLLKVGYIIYPITALLQEILTRCFMQNSLSNVFTGKYKDFLAIIVSSLIFGALHVAHGLNLMIGAFVFLSCLGVYYSKTKNIWGVTLIHYVLGMSVFLLNFT